jgi:hypothetical protein
MLFLNTIPDFKLMEEGVIVLAGVLDVFRTFKFFQW